MLYSINWGWGLILNWPWAGRKEALVVTDELIIQLCRQCSIYIYILLFILLVLKKYFMVFSATFNNISVTSWSSYSFIGGGNQSTQRKSRTARSHWQTCFEYTSPWVGFELTTLAVIVRRLILELHRECRLFPPHCIAPRTGYINKLGGPHGSLS